MIRAFLALWCYLLIVAWIPEASAAVSRRTNNIFEQLTSELDQLRENESTNISSAGILDRIIVDDGDKRQELGICHIATFLPLTILRPVGDGYARIRVPIFEQSTLSGIMAVSLAAQMLNTGDGSVIPEVEGLSDRCPIRFTTEVFDSSSSAAYTAQSTISALDRKREKGDREVCAYLGASRSRVSIPMAILTGLKGRPQLSPYSTSSQLDDKGTFPLFGRTITSEVGLVVPLILYLKERQVNHLGVVHRNDEYGNAYVRSVLEQSATLHPELTIISADLPNRDSVAQDYEDALSVMERSKYRWFFGIFSASAEYMGLMDVAIAKGIAATGKHVWLFNGAGSAPFFETMELPTNSSLALATRGVGLFSALNGLPSSSGTPNALDKFTERFQTLNNAADIAYVNSRLPVYDNVDFDSPGFEGPQVSNSTFGIGDLSIFASTLFDETILLGLSACGALGVSSTKNVTSVSSLSGSAMFGHILNTTFEGATGRIVLDPITASRLPTTAVFRISNAIQVPLNETHVTYKFVDSDIFADGQWRQTAPYIFSDGTAGVPSDVPAAELELNYLGSALRITGFALAGSILFLSIIFAAWTAHYRKNAVVTASQPIFLWILCTGSFLFGATILPISIDDEIWV